MQAPLRIALIAAEAVPFAKVGGLADVAGALPRALEELGAEVVLVLPGYRSIDRQRFGLQAIAATSSWKVPVGAGWEPLHVQRCLLPDTTAVQVLAVSSERLFGRDGIYSDPRTGREFPDTLERLVFFSRGALLALRAIEWRPDVLHLNDYHTALAAAYLRAEYSREPFFAGISTLFSIHNLGYQGLFDARRYPVTGLPAALMAPLGPFEFWGHTNLMKSGLVLSDLLSTVSPTYAREIQEDDELGHGLQGVLRGRSADLFGVLNGIDTRVWNPAHDPLIPETYDLDRPAGKRRCKRALQERLGLPVDPERPLFGSISRLATQKGFDLVLEALPELLQLDLQMVILGSGLKEYEAELQRLARRHPDRLSVQLAFDDALAHWIEAGSDFFLMPSRYEPCGLNQMYSLRYGTVPVVRRTGGLADTVIDADRGTGEGNGFVFEAYRATALQEAVRRAFERYHDPEAMQRLMRVGMRADFGWAASAARYLELYRLAQARHAQAVR